MKDQARRRSPTVLGLKLAGLGLGTLLGLALAWSAGFLWFVAAVPAHVEDATTRTDAIVVLTGGSERLETGLRLLEGGMAGRLFISGVHKDVDVAEILKVTNAEYPQVKCCIMLGYTAGDTVGNAVETAQWMAREHLGSLRLVTGSYHMPRSLLELRHELPGATIVPHPVFPDAVKSREWWRWPGTAALLATEYSKYLAAVVRHWFLPRRPLP